ncbi:GDSL esterase/lipase 5 [Striga hermonthica]|uniref:GDSL esterase/lipase 5 n=1 Tax=Striga hermonthica TaxID=68872 RepID=A0A9N7N2C7_STRHE|nr:GDSL esterase/lipase 5 [Striga hermonthica]
MAKLSILVLAFFFAIVLNGIEGCKQPVIFAFGDSYLDLGNNNYINTSTQDQANFLPYGETRFGNKPTGRFTDGLTIIDYLAKFAGIKGLIPPFLNKTRKIDTNYNGASFASAGAGVLNTTLPGFSVSRDQQVQNYITELKSLSRTFGSKEAKKIASNAVNVITFGATEVIVYFELNTPIPDKTELVKAMIGNLTTVVQEIYNQGGRKFVLLNLLDLGCSPGLKFLNPDKKTGPCLKNASDIVTLYNEAIDNKARDLRQALPHSKITIFDLAQSVASRTAHPEKYNVTDAHDACCGYDKYNGRFSCGGTRPFKKYKVCENPNEYLFWDSFHLTDRAYESITCDIWKRSKCLRDLFNCFV